MEKREWKMGEWKGKEWKMGDSIEALRIGGTKRIGSTKESDWRIRIRWKAGDRLPLRK